MESNEQTELRRKMGTDLQMESRVTARGKVRLGVEGLSKKKRGLTNMENSVVIVGGGG